MVTGIETAGLALAIFPIVMRGLAFYLDTAKEVKESTTGQLATIVNGKGCDDSNFQDRLKQCLVRNAANSPTEGVEAMNTLLEGLKKVIGLDNDSQPLQFDRKHQKRQWKKIKLILDQCKHDAILNDIKKPMQTFMAKNHYRIRDHAKNLYGVLRRRFRDVDQINRGFSSGLRLEVLFHFDCESVMEDQSMIPWHWRSLEFEPAESIPIGCGHSTDELHTADNHNEETQDDINAGSSLLQDQNKKSKVRRALRRIVTKFALTAQGSKPDEKEKCLSPSQLCRYHRNLYHRNLYHRQFPKAGLRYDEGGIRIPYLEPLIDQPFVRGDFANTQSLKTAALLSSHRDALQQPSTSSAFVVPVEKSLFLLGIVLVELWFEHPIEKLRSTQQPQTTNSEVTDSDNIDYQTAKQLHTSAGHDYETVVSDCFDGLNSSHRPNSGTLSTSKSLNNSEYKDAVHTAIVCRLENNLMAFTEGYL
ncbi:hypothetical protein BDD12DRAFT_895556 [Trichophaea hybrida]|nr:hypothetical protein BDD12DRAFT_895556 [Trichophaea hybrida]